MKYLYGLAYALVLITQLPHVWAIYAGLEQPGVPFKQWTALAAAIAFELSTGIFTFRLIQGTKRKWTRRGVWFFVGASAVANLAYYGVWPWVFDAVAPWFIALAIPSALFLFAEEFGAEMKQDERRQKKAERLLKEAEQRESLSEQPAFELKSDHIRWLKTEDPSRTNSELAVLAGSVRSTVTAALKTWSDNGKGIV